jgi:hypothetical protein
MTLLAETLEVFSTHGLRCAVIGATAMAAHGVARATLDIDLLLAGRAALESGAWPDLERRGVEVEIRRGTGDDPLQGVVRLRREAEAPIDVIVGSSAWQRRAIDRAVVSDLLGVAGPVAGALDLILLKLHAGSPQDCWDISRLLAASPPGLGQKVDTEVGALPADARALWESIRDGARR